MNTVILRPISGSGSARFFSPDFPEVGVDILGHGCGRAEDISFRQGSASWEGKYYTLLFGGTVGYNFKVKNLLRSDVLYVEETDRSGLGAGSLRRADPAGVCLCIDGKRTEPVAECPGQTGGRYHLCIPEGGGQCTGAPCGSELVPRNCLGKRKRLSMTGPYMWQKGLSWKTGG